MQTSQKLALATFLGASLALTNCQVVIGVSDLEVTGGAGGQDGTSSQSSSSGTCTGCMPYFGCDATGKECATTCTETSGCTPGSVCFIQPHTCVGCGAVPPQGPCPGTLMGCDECESATGTCVVKCAMPGECAKDAFYNGAGTPVRVECNDQCDGITITSAQTAPLEVVCTSGCNGLKLNCSPDGSCTLTCNGSGCANAQVNCGGNDCLAACKATPVKVTQMCNNSCSCTKSGCL